MARTADKACSNVIRVDFREEQQIRADIELAETLDEIDGGENSALWTCPACGSTVFYISDSEVICFSCDHVL